MALHHTALIDYQSGAVLVVTGINQQDTVEIQQGSSDYTAGTTIMKQVISDLQRASC
jgi:hypothetical protein